MYLLSLRDHCPVFISPLLDNSTRQHAFRLIRMRVFVLVELCYPDATMSVSLITVDQTALGEQAEMLIHRYLVEGQHVGLDQGGLVQQAPAQVGHAPKAGEQDARLVGQALEVCATEE